METAPPRTIRIGKTTIGLIGLDRALHQAAARELDAEEATDFLFAEVSEKNYIPPAATDKYRQALGLAYQQYLEPGDRPDTVPVIKIFSKDCISCDTLQKMVIEALNAAGLAADIEKIDEPDEIGRYGMIMTPALMINGKIKSTGLMPTMAQVEQWIRELA